jgi:DNA-3-methyladenine glycosylase I
MAVLDNMAVLGSGAIMDSKTRCGWARTDIEIAYHDQEWGVPLHDDQKLFEFLVLEGAQAGLSWVTILKKREAYRKAFDQFEISKVARYRTARVEKLLANAGIVRNRLKVEAAVVNARCTLAAQEEFGSLDAYLWQFVDGRPVVNAWKSMKEIPATSPQSDAMSKDMRRRGFKFVGSTICYAMMQAVGMVNDHPVDCFRYKQV